MVQIIITACITATLFLGVFLFYLKNKRSKTQIEQLAEDTDFTLIDQALHPAPLNLEIYNQLNELPKEINNEAVSKLAQARDNFDLQKDRIDKLHEEVNSLIEQIHPYHGKNKADFSNTDE